MPIYAYCNIPVLLFTPYFSHMITYKLFLSTTKCLNFSVIVILICHPLKIKEVDTKLEKLKLKLYLETTARLSRELS